jgi:hypothetical protein
MAVKTTDCEMLCITVMLCITANDNKLPPYVIFNRRTVPKENFWKTVLDVNGNISLVHYQSHRVG